MSYSVYAYMWLACGALGWFIGAHKDKGFLGAVLGLALSVIGVVIIAIVVAVSKAPKRPVSQPR